MKTAVVSDKLHGFSTPDYAPPEDSNWPGQKFSFLIKPYGVRAWFQSTYIAEDVIMLIDPDMIILKPFNNHLPEAGDFYVQPGKPAGATYGIGPKWTGWHLCDENDCNATDNIAWKHYSVGPPYIMHKTDWYKLIDRWAYYSPDALKNDPPPSVLAEMYST
eukprot:UN21912